MDIVAQDATSSLPDPSRATLSLSGNRASRSGMHWLIAWRGLRMPAARTSLSSAAPGRTELRRPDCAETRSPRLCRVVLAVRGDRVVGDDRAGRVALLRPASIVALSSAKGTRCVLAQNRGCPRNCRRRAFLDGPLDDTPGRSRRALSRKPGDLPATHLVPALGWRAYGE